MAESDSAPRRYQAPCPNCGAPVSFVSAQATHAVCEFCRSSVVREGDVLRRLGRVGELFEDHSPLRLGMAGTWRPKGGSPVGFTLIGRQQFQGEAGSWTEWLAQGAQGESLVLSEDNGRYVMSQKLATGSVPKVSQLKLDQVLQVNRVAYTVTSLMTVHLRAAEGEFFSAPPVQGNRTVVELRSADGAVLSWDDTADMAAGTPPEVYQGRTVALADLGIAGLNTTSTKKEQAQQFNCVACGAPVSVMLESTKSITCGSCHALMDLSRGVGRELRAAVQDEPIRPLIALGSMGKFEGVAWQVVGFIHKMGYASAEDEDEDDESFGWEEYVLFHRERGFAFLVDTVEGWSWVSTVAGAPQRSGKQQTAQYQGSSYSLVARYESTTEYVAGEFYWPVQRGQSTQHADYRAGNKILSMESAGQETVWSQGRTLTPNEVALAFGRQSELGKFRRDAGEPIAGLGSQGRGIMLAAVALVILLVLMLSFCSGDERPRCRPNPHYDPSNLTDPKAAQREICESSNARAGSYGGYSSGGSHK